LRLDESNRLPAEVARDHLMLSEQVQNRGCRRPIRSRRLRRAPDPDRGMRWRVGCYPAVTPALELARFEFQTRRRTMGFCPRPSDAKRLPAREIRW
jgi:hypothetical protein